jgi:hypothetical protein
MGIEFTDTVLCKGPWLKAGPLTQGDAMVNFCCSEAMEGAQLLR